MKLEKDSDLKLIEEEIKKGNDELTNLHDGEAHWHKKIKYLTSCRERMARNASQAKAQEVATKEESKVKDLLILDLAKKLQETEFRLKSFVSMYEEVKNARNKYVQSIYHASQDLAEIKERLKILQNEVEILRNESNEKDKALTKARHNLQVEVYIKENLLAFLSKQNVIMQDRQHEVERQVSEIEKLNQAINQLETEMKDLRTK